MNDKQIELRFFNFLSCLLETEGPDASKKVKIALYALPTCWKVKVTHLVEIQNTDPGPRFFEQQKPMNSVQKIGQEKKFKSVPCISADVLIFFICNF